MPVGNETNEETSRQNDRAAAIVLPQVADSLHPLRYPPDSAETPTREASREETNTVLVQGWPWTQEELDEARLRRNLLKQSTTKDALRTPVLPELPQPIGVSENPEDVDWNQ